MKRSSTLWAMLCLAAAGASAQTPHTPGVTKTEIVIGTIQDLSGPLAGYGKQVQAGMQMAVDEANDKGGIYGRKVRLLVEDSGYDPKKAVLAAQKMVGQDAGIFAMVSHIGTAQNMAAMPVLFEKNVINFFPLAAARQMYEPLHRLKFSNAATYYDQMRIAAPRLAKDKGLKRVCALYQDDDFGMEVLNGAEAGLKTIAMEMTEKTSYKRGATDFSSQVAKLKAAQCELVILGTIIRETVGTIAEARKTGFNPVFVGSSAIYTDIIPKLGGKAVDNLYATMTAQHPYADASEEPVRQWTARFKAKYNADPGVFAVYGYAAVFNFLRAAHRTGPQLTTDNFVATMDRLVFNRDMFGGAEQSFSPTKRLGNQYSRLSQLQDGRWKVVSDYVAFSGLRPVERDQKWVVESEFMKD